MVGNAAESGSELSYGDAAGPCLTPLTGLRSRPNVRRKRASMPSGKPMKIDLQRCEWCRQLPSTDRIVIKCGYHRMCEHCAGLVMADAVSMRTDEPNALRCGFCGKLRDEVASLIEGLDGLRTATNARLRPSSWRRSASAGDRAHARTAGKPAQRRSSGRQRAASRQRTGEAPTGPRSGWPARRVSRGGGCSRRAPAGARPRHRRREERHSSAANTGAFL